MKCKCLHKFWDDWKEFCDQGGTVDPAMDMFCDGGKCINEYYGKDKV